MLKGIKYFLASVFCALVFSCAPTHALSVTSLERISPDSDQIEINEPSAGYSFDATFLDKNQTLSYNATITNETGGTAKIESINLTNSQHQFLEYSYSGLSIDGKTISSFETEITGKDGSSLKYDSLTQTVTSNSSGYLGKFILVLYGLLVILF